MAEVRKCKCGCGATLEQFKGENSANFAKRKYHSPECNSRDRRNREGGWHANTKVHSNEGLTREDFDRVPRCRKCKLMKIRLRRNGFGITDSKQFCICNREYDEMRGAWI